MQITKNHSRFQINHLDDVGYEKKGQKVKGIAGFHGPIARILGIFLEKFFHKTVGLQGNDGRYFLNCKSLQNWAERNKQYQINPVELRVHIHDAKWIQNLFDNVIPQRMLKPKTQELQKETKVEPAKAIQTPGLPLIPKQIEPVKPNEEKPIEDLNQTPEDKNQDLLKEEIRFPDQPLPQKVKPQEEIKELAFPLEIIPQTYENLIEDALVEENPVKKDEDQPIQKEEELPLEIKEEKPKEPVLKKIDLDLITKEELIKLDFSTVELSVDIVKRLFDTEGAPSPASQLFFDLSLPNIYHLIPYFSHEHWLCLTNDHIRAFDFTQIPSEQIQTMVDKLFPADDFDSRLPLIDENQLYLVVPHLSAEQLENVSDKQAIALDYSKIDLEKKGAELVKSLFGWLDFFEDKGSKRIPRLSLENIYLLSRFLNGKWQYLNDDQVEKFDFSRIKLDKQIVDVIFTRQAKKYEKRLKNLKDDQLEIVKPYLSDLNLEYVKNTLGK